MTARQESESQSWVTLARIVRPQGRRGEVLCDLLIDFPERFREAGCALFLSLPGKERMPVLVDDAWMPTGRSAGRIVLKLAGTDSISAAELLLGAEVQLAAGERVTLPDGNYYVSDLLGCQITNGGEVIGTVVDMHFPQDTTGRRMEEAPSIFVVHRAEGDELLIPFANAFVQSVDVDAKRITMRLPDGLLSLNG